MKQTARIIRNNVPYTLLGGVLYCEPIHVPSVSAARLLPDPPPAAIHIGSAGESVTGTYYWDNANTDADDGQTRIKVTAITNGRYKPVSIIPSVGAGSALSVTNIAALKAVLSTTLIDTQPSTVQDPGSSWVWSANTGAGFASDDRTVIKPNNIALGVNGRWYNTASAPVLPTVAALRLAISGKQDSISLQAFSTLGDGGGGTFDKQTGSPPADDGGVNIVPTGATTFWYKRRIHGHRISVKWWGAKGDGVTDDKAAVRAAAKYVNDNLTTVSGITIGATTVYGDGGLYTSLDLYFPQGIYLVDEISLITGGVVADNNATLFADADSKVILRLGGWYNRIRGLTFAGGKNAIRFFGSNDLFSGTPQGNPVAATTEIIEHCTFRAQTGPAIYQYLGDTGYTTKHIIVNKCYFQTPVVCWLRSDDAQFDHCTVQVQYTHDTPTDVSGMPLGVFNSFGKLQLNDINGIPTDTGATNACWVQGTGQLQLDDVRLGGESALTGIRIRCASIVYDGINMSGITAPIQRASLIIRNSAIASCNALNWLEIYDPETFPTRIELRSPLPFPTSLDVDSYSEIPGTLGIWVHSNVDVDVFGKGSTVIRLEGDPGANAYRWRQSTNPASSVGTDITHKIRQYCDRESSLWANQNYAAQLPAKNNLYTIGYFDVQDHGGSTAVSNVGFSTDDTSLGFTIKTMIGTGADPAARQYVRELGPVWGASYAAGEYCFSFLFKASWSGRVTITRDGRTLGERSFVANGGWQRLWFPFEHLGADELFEFAITEIPLNGTFNAAAFMINTGATPAPYLRPATSTAAITEPSLPTDATVTSTIENRLRGVYHRRTVPAAGTWVQDDLILKVGRTANDPLGWSVTTGGVAGSGAVFTPIGVGITATATTRAVRTYPKFSATEYSIDNDFLLTTLLATQSTAIWPIEIPNGSTLTTITVKVNGTNGHGGLPGTMPGVRWSKWNISTASGATSAATLDSSGDVPTFEGNHTIVKSGINEVIDNTTTRYAVLFDSEDGANALAGLVVLGVTVGFTTGTIDDMGAS